MAGMMQTCLRLALRWSLVIAMLVAWELLTATRTFTPFMLPSPESVLERIWRDARIERIWDGTSEIQRHILSRSLLRAHGG